jgi:hypothetical protein
MIKATKEIVQAGSHGYQPSEMLLTILSHSNVYYPTLPVYVLFWCGKV